MEGQEKQLRKFFSHFSTSSYSHDQKEIQLDEKLSTSQCCGFSFLGVFSCFSKKKSVAGVWQCLNSSISNIDKLPNLGKQYCTTSRYPRQQQHSGMQGQPLCGAAGAAPCLTELIPVAPVAPSQATAEHIKKNICRNLIITFKNNILNKCRYSWER